MSLNASLVEESFALVAPRAEELVRDFYQTLFKDYPQVRPLFSGVDQRGQEKKLLAALKLVVNNLRKTEALLPVLRDLGAHHVNYGAEPVHYAAVGATLLKVLARYAGPAWTKEVEEAWTAAYAAIQEAMLDGAAKTQQRRHTAAGGR